MFSMKKRLTDTAVRQGSKRTTNFRVLIASLVLCVAAGAVLYATYGLPGGLFNATTDQPDRNSAVPPTPPQQ